MKTCLPKKANSKNPINVYKRLLLKVYQKLNHFLSSSVYQDVARSFRRWTDLGIKLYIYSSGSVEAQKLLFGHSNDGNLLNVRGSYV